MALFSCPRCNGKGFIAGFGHVADGRCFSCGGSGTLSASAKSLNDAERAGLELTAHRAVVEARACTEAQEAFLDRIARRLGVPSAALVCAVSGLRAGYHQPEFTRAAVSRAIDTFRAMAPADARRTCYPARAA